MTAYMAVCSKLASTLDMNVSCISTSGPPVALLSIFLVSSTLMSSYTRTASALLTSSPADKTCMSLLSREEHALA